MVRTQLSSNFLAEKIVIIVVVIIPLPFLFAIKDYPAIGILLFIVYGFCSLSIYTAYYEVSDIVYDDLSLYIKFKKQEKAIPLKEITEIKLTARWGSWRKQWGIVYIENNEEKRAYCYLKYGLISLAPFVKAVKRQNSKVDINYIALDIDFD